MFNLGLNFIWFLYLVYILQIEHFNIMFNLWFKGLCSMLYLATIYDIIIRFVMISLLSLINNKPMAVRSRPVSSATHQPSSDLSSSSGLKKKNEQVLGRSSFYYIIISVLLGCLLFSMPFVESTSKTVASDEYNI